MRNFDQMQLGDQVVVRYMRALSLELKKTGSAITESSEKADAVRAQARRSVPALPPRGR